MEDRNWLLSNTAVLSQPSDLLLQFIFVFLGCVAHFRAARSKGGGERGSVYLSYSNVVSALSGFSLQIPSRCVRLTGLTANTEADLAQISLPVRR